MKRKIACGLILILIFQLAGFVWGEDITLKPEVRVPELVAASISTDAAKAIPGNPKGYEGAMASRFSDIGSTPQRNDILRIALEGIVKGTNGGQYRPASAITRQEALVYLVRLRGNEAAVQQRLSTAAGASVANYSNQLYREYANEAITLGILNATEDGSLDKTATREEVSVWLARALSLTASYGDQSIINSLVDGKNIQPADRGLVEAMMAEKIVIPDQGGKFNSTRTVTRAEMAQLLNRVVSKQYQAQGIASNYGVVGGSKTDTRYEGGASINETSIVVKNIDGTIATLTTDYNSKTKIHNDFPVLKNGSIVTGAQLASGDQIEYLVQNNQVKLVQVYTDGTIIKRIKDDSMKNQTWRTYYGNAVSRISENRQMSGKMYRTDRVRIKNQTGQTFDLVVDTEASTGIRNDVIVSRNGVVGGAALIQDGDFLEYAVLDPNVVLYITATPAQISELKGTVRTVEAMGKEGLPYINIMDYNSAIYRYPVAGYADISVNTEYAKLSDLKFGQNISLTLNNALVTGIQAETFTSPGYIEPETKMRNGVVQQVKGSELSMRCDDGTVITVSSDDLTVYRKNSQVTSMGTIQIGDRIKAYFSDSATLVASRIDIEGKEQLLEGIYKGKVVKVTASKNEVTLSNPQKLSNQQWVSTGQYMQSFELEPQAKTYYKGQLITLEKLKGSLINSEVYIAVKDSYSKDTGVKMVVKNGSERMHYDKVDTVSQAAERFELNNKINFAFDSGTLIVRENRLIDNTSIQKGVSALVVSTYSKGAYNADVISLLPEGGETGIPLWFKNIYLGYVDRIYSSEFKIRGYSQLKGLIFEDMSTSSLTLGYGTDTDIFNVTASPWKTLDAYAFFNGGYSSSENVDTSTDAGIQDKYWYAFVVTDDDKNAQTVMLRKSAVLRKQDIDNTVGSTTERRNAIQDAIDQLMLTRGTVNSIDATTKRIRLQDSTDYSEFQKQWLQNRVDTYITINDTIIMKDNKRIEFSDIQSGDRLDIVRAKADAVIVFVEN